MFFDDINYSKKYNISDSLLWEYDLTNFDWQSMKIVVVQRVVERGNINDFISAIQLYGGINNFINILKQIPSLCPIDMNFVSKTFNIPKEELKCYTHKQSRLIHINS